MDMAFITGFNVQYRSEENFIKKLWPILLKDDTLRSILPKDPSFIYRRAPGLRNKIAKNVVDPPSRNITFLDR